MCITNLERWRLDHACELMKLMFMVTMSKYFSKLLDPWELKLGFEAMGMAEYKDIIKKAGKCISDCGTTRVVNGAVAAVKSLLAAKLLTVQFDTGPEQHYNIQFNNCVFDIKEMCARARTRSDYVTQILDYDYMPRDEIRDEVHAEVRQFFEKLQPDAEQRRFKLGYMAYCLTGNTDHQIMKMNIGYSASNGKSTELKVHALSFPIYSTKLDKRTFNVTYEKRHKELLGLIDKPIRLAYIEELDRLKLDEDMLKDVVDGHELSVEVLYSTKKVKQHQCKLMTCSNKDPNVAADAGLKRRIKCQLYSSRFLDGVDDDDEKHVYRKVHGFEKKFANPEYKNAYFHLLLEHIGHLHVPRSAGEYFEEIAEDNDDFLNQLEGRFKITHDSDDRLSKREIEKFFEEFRMKWSAVLQHLKRLGLTYVRDERMQFDDVDDGCNINVRGAIHGIRHREPTDDMSESHLDDYRKQIRAEEEQRKAEYERITRMQEECRRVQAESRRKHDDQAARKRGALAEMAASDWKRQRDDEDDD